MPHSPRRPQHDSSTSSSHHHARKSPTMFELGQLAETPIQSFGKTMLAPIYVIYLPVAVIMIQMMTPTARCCPTSLHSTPRR
eukprot:scaffold27484_cov74-Skeletonema_dohrnii-CCMP3373.AAC.1